MTGVRVALAALLCAVAGAVALADGDDGSAAADRSPAVAPTAGVGAAAAASSTTPPTIPAPSVQQADTRATMPSSERAGTSGSVATDDTSGTDRTDSRTARDPATTADLWAGYVLHDVGCAGDLTAAGLEAFFSQQIGAIEGFDGPRLYPLGDGRVLWMLQDTFIDYADVATSFAHMDYANSTALIQTGACFTSIQRGTTTTAESFEQGDGMIDFDRYFWPAGGSVRDGTLQMFWMEMRRDPEVGPLDGIALHPCATWLATYDVRTMERLDFRPAPNAGVSPVYGYTVVDDGEWSYLFGNSYLQNLALEGGVGNGPHSATRMSLARVPRGQLDDPPMYWDGTGWSANADDAEPISSRFWTENSMLPVKIGELWVSATKVDGFLGSGISVDVAAQPWGPWETAALLPAEPRGSQGDLVTYHAMVLPWQDANGELILSLSQIPMALGADDAPPRYRPRFFAVDIADSPVFAA